MVRLIGSGALLLALLAPTAARSQEVPDGPENVQVLLSPDEALKEIFPEAVAVSVRTWRPSPAERERLTDRLSRGLYEPTYEFLLAYDRQQRLLGYAVVTEERGKYRPITFMVGVTPELRVRDAAVMVYRESRGGEVQRRRFLTQYRGKTMRDPIQLNRDIVNISGATISVRSLNTGVKKVLALTELALATGLLAEGSGRLMPVASLR